MRYHLVLAALLCSSAAYAQDSPSSVITTEGRSQAALRPTSALLQLRIETRAASASAASGENGARQQRVMESMRRIGLRDDRIQLVSFTVRAAINYESQKVLGYEASAEVAITISPLERLGMIIDSSLAAGATEVEDVDFTSDSLATVRERLLIEAVAAARRDAEVLASAAGGRLGPLLTIAASSCTGSDRIAEVLALQPGVIGGATTSSIAAITPGQVKVQVAVCTRWQLVK